MKHITINSDGGARGNPGPSGAGAVIREEEKVVEEISQFLGEQTNNWAEYEALRLALVAVGKRYGGSAKELAVTARLDSELVVRQLNGLYQVKEPSLKEQYRSVTQLLPRFKSVAFVHVPREENSEADRLANDAMDQAGKIN